MEFVADVLQLIDVGANEIADAVTFYGRKYPELKSLGLEENNLTMFCFPPEEVAPGLYYVNLFSNNLTNIRLPPDLRDVEIMLAKNPWHCDWRLAWVHQCSYDAKKLRLKCTQGVLLDEFNCTSPAKAKGMSPWHVGEDIS